MTDEKYVMFGSFFTNWNQLFCNHQKQGEFQKSWIKDAEKDYLMSHPFAEWDFLTIL